jgi:ABC-type phosphate transport system substrate-binding protein
MRLLSQLILLVWLLTPGAGVHAEPGIAIIMAPGAVPARLTHDELSLIFKAKKQFWDDGRRIQALNLPVTHPLRRAFSSQVLKHSPEELEDYWSGMYFQGVLPPHVFDSEEAVIRFVSITPGAIGYVSHCAVDHRIIVVMQLDSGYPCQKP